MFEKQIERLELLISDWNKIKVDKSEISWSLAGGLCKNCYLHTSDLQFQLDLSWDDVDNFKDKMWSSWSGYSGQVDYPLSDFEDFYSFFNFTETPERLELAKCVLQFLKDYAKEHENV